MKARLLLIAIVVVALASCDLAAFFGADTPTDTDTTTDTGDDTNDDGSDVNDGSELSGTVDADLTLSATDRSPDYTVTSDLTVQATLTIDPGVEIAFAEDVLLDITSTGAIVADGTSAEPITLTSTDPSAGIRWSGIRIQSSSMLNSISHAVVEYAGGHDDHYLSGWRAVGISVYASAYLSLENTTIRNSGDWGLFSHGEVGSFAANVFTDNTGPAASIHPNDWGTIDSATTFSGNGFDGVLIDAAFDLTETESVSPLSTGAAYLVDGDLSVVSALTVAAGTRIEMDAKNEHGDDYGMIRVETGGSLDAQGTALSPIVFTSSDEAGGQRWNGIAFESASASNVFDHVEVLYGGRVDEHYLSEWRAVGVSVYPGARLSIQNSTISFSGDWGLFSHGEVTAFSANEFADNAGPAVSIHPNDWGQVAGTSTFSNNLYDGVIIEASFDLSEAQTVSPIGSAIPYLVDGELNVAAGLTINPGTVVEFDAQDLYGESYGKLVVTGSGFLNAVGTSTDLITFTSSDVVGAQHWNGITFETASASNQLDYVTVSYGGRQEEHYVGGWRAANVALESGAALTVTNSTLSFAQMIGGTAYGLVVDDLASINGVSGGIATATDVSSNTFSNNDADFAVF